MKLSEKATQADTIKSLKRNYQNLKNYINKKKRQYL